MASSTGSRSFKWDSRRGVLGLWIVVAALLVVGAGCSTTSGSDAEAATFPGSEPQELTPGNVGPTTSLDNTNEVTFGPNARPQDRRFLAEAKARFRMPPGAGFVDPLESMSSSKATLIDMLAWSTACEWYRYLIDGSEAGDSIQVASGIEGLRQLRDQSEPSVVLIRTIDEIVVGAEHGDIDRAVREVEINCGA